MDWHAPTRKLRLYVFRPTLGQGGAEKTTVLLLKYLERTRFDLTLVLMKREGIHLGDVPTDVRVISLDAANLWSALGPLTRFLSKEHPDILYSPGGTDIPLILAHRLTGRHGRLVISERNTVYHGERTPKRRLVVGLKRALYPLATQLTAVSEGVKHDMVETLGIRPERIEVVYNPVIDEALTEGAQEAVEHPWFRGEVPVILGVGRLVPQKDHGTLLRAFAFVRQQCTAKLLILGEGPQRQELEDLATELGVEKEVCFGGFEKNPFKYMSKCAVFVLSSKHEGLPGVLIQAMACGAPVISTDCPFGPSEIITEPNANGILVPVGDAVTMAKRIEQLLAEPDQAREMGRRGKEAVEKFRVGEAMQQHVRVLTGTNAEVELTTRPLYKNAVS